MERDERHMSKRAVKENLYRDLLWAKTLVVGHDLPGRSCSQPPTQRQHQYEADNEECDQGQVEDVESVLRPGAFALKPIRSRAVLGPCTKRGQRPASYAWMNCSISLCASRHSSRIIFPREHV
jgi:hypothetical protein